MLFLLGPFMSQCLIALPVFNEVKTVEAVLNEVKRYCDDVLVVDDGSTDGTLDLLSNRNDILLEIHPSNRGYGAALNTAFKYTLQHDYDCVVTIDCDGQHEPQRIPLFSEACERPDVDIVSGSRYLKQFDEDTAPPEQRRLINKTITAELNDMLCLELTDAFCGFKAYTSTALREFNLTEDGYAMPLELWVQAAAAKLRVQELAVPLIYLDEKRSFGGTLDDGTARLKYYREVIARAVESCGVDFAARRAAGCG